MTRGEILVVDPSFFTLPYDHELCRALVRRGECVRLIGRTLRTGERTASEADYRFDPLFADPGSGDGMVSLRTLRKGLAHVAGMIRLQRLVRQIRPAAVSFQWLALAPVDRIMLPILARNCPLLLTAHDASAGGGRGFGRLQTIGWRGALGCFSHIVVHTRDGAEALRRSGVERNRIHVLGHPVLPLAAASPARSRHSSGPLRLMIFGEIKPYKGVDVAIEALALLPPDVADAVRLAVVGRPRMDLAPLKNMAERLGVAPRVEWIDRYVPVGELPEVLGRADVFLLPYRSVDASGALAQLLHLGRPIVASQTGSLAEVVGGSGCGIVTEPGGPAELAAAVERLVRNPADADAMGEAARRASAELPSWGEMAGLLVEAVG